MQQEKKLIEFLQQNSLDGGFLQSPEWLKFQQKVGRKIHPFQKENFIANIIEHTLPLVGKYLYVPRGPICKPDQKQLSLELQKLINLAKKENVGWIRIEPATNEIFEIIKENVSEKVIKAPHDMQPKEIFLIDILKTEQELLSQMKPKTRYNINLAKKKGVNVLLAKNEQEKKEHIQAFLSLTKEMAERQGITAHPEEYYRKMIESFS